MEIYKSVDGSGIIVHAEGQEVIIRREEWDIHIFAQANIHPIDTRFWYLEYES